ncbi:hypothetical protein [Streptomyces sp. NPDC008125]|uniref:hypothetical protein n=1 Tax=Streptomyces sp. NPDC008125 TaxID=3364811 RepID=UPI0036EB6494
MSYPRTERSRIPDAVAAIVAGVIEEHPNAGPETIGRLAVVELAREGWHWHLGHRLRCAPADVSNGSAGDGR